ncbi:MAG: ParB/RepB/Spo0J family partition protein, partial [Rhodoferax sp.]|uniref:ParB/RepB/Spo0J family partition protein n=1 Tax=Rhodoferax sp. TaxID=50421 RepID=UPI001B6294D2
VGVGSTVSDVAPTSNDRRIIRVPVRLLDDSPSQHRLTYPPEEIDALSRTLTGGQVEPIRIRKKTDGRYELIAGHRRTRAARIASLEFLDAVLVDVDDLRAAVELVLSNDSHEEVGDFERATGYRHLMSMGLKQTQIADTLGINRSLVSLRLKFFEFPQVVLDVLAKYPRAYAHRTANQLLEILKETPSLADVVADGTKRVANGDWSAQTLISVLRQRQKATDSRLPSDKPLSIVDSQSRPLLTLKSNPKGRVEIRLASVVNQERFIAQLAQFLRDEAQKDSLGFVDL